MENIEWSNKISKINNTFSFNIKQIKDLQKMALPFSTSIEPIFKIS